MNKVDTITWTVHSVLGVLLLVLLTAPTELLAQERVQSYSELEGLNMVIPTDS